VPRDGAFGDPWPLKNAGHPLYGAPRRTTENKMAAAEQVTYRGLVQTEPTLPASYYIDADHYRRELEAIWYRDWLYVCPASTMPEPRCYRVYEVGDQSVLIVRDENGTLRAFHNSCRHRGSVLCTAEQGRLPW
jgi:Rieske 2Fe-2S family protein